MRNYYPNFDWLRLLLAIQVVAIHSGVAPTVFINPVPAFLAISGFVVFSSIERRSIPTFFINRALRVLPLLFVSFICIGLLFGGKEMFHTVMFWLWPFGEQPINGVVWSLMYEEFYYVILVILFSIGFYKRKFLPQIICFIFIAMTISNEFLGLPSQLFMLGGAFFIGNLAYIYRELILKINSWIALILLLVIVGIVFTLPYTNIVDPGRAYLDFISFAAILVFAIAGPQLPKLKIDISYSLYLSHVIVRQQFFGYIPLGMRMFWVVLLCTLPICYAAWHFIESPALRFKNKLTQKTFLKSKETSKA
jgi:peptidoglycan/LPS O-acetylase OafA/YrhL